MHVQIFVWTVLARVQKTTHSHCLLAGFVFLTPTEGIFTSLKFKSAITGPAVC